jgi:hypothetical protein
MIGLGFNYNFENESVRAGCTLAAKTLDKKVRWFKHGWGDGSELDSGDIEHLLDKAGIDSNVEWNLKFDIEGSERLLFSQFTSSHLNFKLSGVITC